MMKRFLWLCVCMHSGVVFLLFFCTFTSAALSTLTAQTSWSSSHKMLVTDFNFPRLFLKLANMIYKYILINHAHHRYVFCGLCIPWVIILSYRIALTKCNHPTKTCLSKFPYKFDTECVKISEHLIAILIDNGTCKVLLLCIVE